MRYLVLMLVCFSLSACSVFSPVKTEGTTSYVLNTLPSPSAARKPQRRIILLVPQTMAVQAYNTTQMAYTTKPYEIAYFAKNRWIDTPADMLQNLLVQALQDTHYFYAVVLAPAAAQYDVILNTRLLQFEQRFFSGKSAVFITLRAQLVRSSDNRVMASRQFQAMAAAPQNTPYGGVIAANQAAAKLLAEVVGFCLEYKRSYHSPL
jgi:cholesterol transport system auxiliary component